MAILQIKEAAQVRDSMRRGGTVGLGDDIELETRVRAIMGTVRAQGDGAILAFTKELDGVDLTERGIRVRTRVAWGPVRPRRL